MKFEKIPLIMPNVVKINMQLREEQFEQGFEKMRSIEYEENVYRIAPLFYRISEEDRDEEIRAIDFYMSISEIPPNFPYETIKLFEINDTIEMRQADLEPNLTIAREKLAEYASEKYGKSLSSDMYCVYVDLYNEILVDIYIPMN